ncbi:MAG: sensor histidine kinase [Puniceicoccaceae bacterium]
MKSFSRRRFACLSLWMAPALFAAVPAGKAQPEGFATDDPAFIDHASELRAADYGPITSLRELRQLSPVEAALGLPVDVTGVITYAEVSRNIVFIQNEDGAAYVNIRTANGRVAGRPGLSLEAGDRVRLRGISHPGGFTPSIWYPEDGNVRVDKLGKAPPPEPMQLFPTVVLDPPLDSHWVEVTGVVTEVGTKDGRTAVTFNDGFDDFDLLIKGRPDSARLPEGLVNSRIRARGVFGALTNDRRELVGARFFVPSPASIEIIERGAAATFAKEPLSYDELTGYQAVTGERVHLRGVVTAAFPPSRLYLRMEDGPIEIRTNLADPPPVGARVGVAGYRGTEAGAPYLHTAVFRAEGGGPPPEPRTVSITSPVASMRKGELIRVEGRLADAVSAAGESLLVIDEGPDSFTARLPGRIERRDFPPPKGSLLALTGILVEAPDPGNPGPGFELLLRDIGDIAVLERPPFWTGARVVTILGLALLAIGVLSAWSIWLSRKVRRQAKNLAARKEVERVQEERNRIARELHDTLEQDLVALSMHLNLAHDRMNGADAGSRENLERAQRILQRTRRESRHSIQELREVDFAHDELNGALRRLAERFEMENGISLDLRLPPPHRLPPETQRQVLLILREAIHNAIHHADVRTITLSGESRGNDLLLEVRDEGRGFDPGRLPKGHFGVLGMRERAGRIGAALVIESAAGQGTRVRLTLPGKGSGIGGPGRGG